MMSVHHKKINYAIFVINFDVHSLFCKNKEWPHQKFIILHQKIWNQNFKILKTLSYREKFKD
jgi:hypothetical protein